MTHNATPTAHENATFVDWWKTLNLHLAIRGAPQARYGEAREWFKWRPVKFVDERLVNRIINDRKLL